ncbi:TetR/AcrR family transcriptional regulator [Luteolibacter luteus]|uniref:TetR/AcrR family transcriptional regulator n=1 Tax=Luteolibacter luteus TaxID=2728835 RepID=A0A858RNF1_9BACT|nr:TetR/AcrR family transcriptional regulator [Luteolibacter luteus]QJE98392.1 TetR/AcrR family transcriptional regulator [Luteolibacter luteus]
MPAGNLPPEPKRGSAAAKLLEAAPAVFARDGLSGATTREIAKEAGVNEVTLFRNFQTKEGLLGAVLEKLFERKADPLAERFDNLPQDASLQETVTAFAESDHAMLMRNIAMVRVLVGEIHKFEEHEMKVLRAIFKPRREQLVKRLRAAQARGEVIDSVDPVIVVDQLVGMIFTHALRSDCPMKLEYGRERYVKACVDMVVRAIAKDPS